MGRTAARRDGSVNGRWTKYYLNRDFSGFWRRRLTKPDATVCIIGGIGFDPRSLTAIELLAGCRSTTPIDCVTLNLRPPSSQLSESYSKLEALTDKNIGRLKSIANVNIISEEEISLRDAEGHLVGGRNAAKILSGLFSAITNHRDIIIDISGLPRTIFYPLIAYLCQQSDIGKIRNLHVVVTQNSALDGCIRGGEYGNPDYLYGFRPTSSGDLKLVWLPAISSSESSRLEKIHNQIERECAEICPILPFPAKNLRRADEIIMQMRSILFERMLVSENNLLLCDEQSPFDIYRKILEVDDYYKTTLSALDGLGDITTVVSPLASKMLSLGMLLAAIERKLPVSYTEAGSYQIDGDLSVVSIEDAGSPVEIWLTGEPYE